MDLTQYLPESIVQPLLYLVHTSFWISFLQLLCQTSLEFTKPIKNKNLLKRKKRLRLIKKLTMKIWLI